MLSTILGTSAIWGQWRGRSCAPCSRGEQTVVVMVVVLLVGVGGGVDSLSQSMLEKEYTVRAGRGAGVVAHAAGQYCGVWRMPWRCCGPKRQFKFRKRATAVVVHAAGECCLCLRTDPWTDRVTCERGWGWGGKFAVNETTWQQCSVRSGGGPQLWWYMQHVRAICVLGQAPGCGCVLYVPRGVFCQREEVIQHHSQTTGTECD